MFIIPTCKKVIIFGQRESFENVLNLKHDHAFALLYLSKCYQEIGDTGRAKEIRKKAIHLFKTDEIWNFYYNKFNITTLVKMLSFFQVT